MLSCGCRLQRVFLKRVKYEPETYDIYDVEEGNTKAGIPWNNLSLSQERVVITSRYYVNRALNIV